MALIDWPVPARLLGKFVLLKRAIGVVHQRAVGRRACHRREPRSGLRVVARPVAWR